VFSVFESPANSLVHSFTVCLLICVHYWVSCGSHRLYWIYPKQRVSPKITI